MPPHVAINDVLSTVQEDIGVNVFSSAFLLLAAAVIWRGRALPRWSAVMAAVAGLSYLVSTSEFLGVPNGEIVPILGPVLSGLWLAALGIHQALAPRVDVTARSRVTA